MIESFLKTFGLSSYETKVYIALLDLGESTSSKILERAQIQTGKIYQILDSLHSKGFVSKIIKNNIKHYSPTNPNTLINQFNEKEKELKDQKKTYLEILPELLSKIENKKEETHIEVFTGWNGMKKVYQYECSKYRENEELLISGIIDYENHPKKIIDYFKFNVFPKRDQSKIIIKKIADNSTKNNRKEKRTQTRYLPYSSYITTNIIADVVILSIWNTEPIFIIIESKTVSKGFKENFNLLWKMTK